jgi:hypothetical protein
MRNVKYTFWQDGEFFLGYLNEYPDYWSQGYSKNELMENLRDLLIDMESGEVPFVRKVEEMAVAYEEAQSHQDFSRNGVRFSSSPRET